MQHTLISPPPASPHLDFNSSPAFNVLIAYEDFETGKHAKKTYDFLVDNLGRDCRFTNQMWKFDVLSIPKLREIAVKDALTADIIILSGHGDELPGHVTTWIESWLMEARNALALVALLDGANTTGRQRCATREYLARVAERGKMEFFAKPQNWADSKYQEEQLLFSRGPDLNGRTLSALAGVVQRDVSFPRWGINE
jgi:hypothetical protein